MGNLIRRRREASEPVSTPRRFDLLESLRDILRFDPYGEMESITPALFGMDAGFVPQIEVKETKDAFVFRADLPGVSEQDLDVSVTGNRLTISGKRAKEEEHEDERYYAFERSFGSFNRSFTLPEGADLEHINADLKNGVLQITVPKAEHVQPKKVPISVAEKPAEPVKEPEKQAPPTEATTAAETEVRPLDEKKPKAA